MSGGIRTFHRWTSIVFTLGFVGNMAMPVFLAEPPVWTWAFAFLPLMGLLTTGLYLFGLPYVRQWRSTSA